MDRLTRRSFLTGLAAAAGGTVLAACAPQVVKETVIVEKSVEKVVEKVVTAAPVPVETVEIRASHWWGTFMKPSYEAATKALPMTVIDEMTPHGEYRQKLLTQLAGGVAPDLILVDAYWFGDFWPSGRMAALGDLVQDKDMTKWGVDPRVENGFDGKFYGMSMFYPEQSSIWINKEICDKDGITIPELGDPDYDQWDWDDFVEVLSALTHRNSDGSVEQWGMTPLWGCMCGAILQTLYQNGGKLFDTDDNWHENEILLTTPECIEAMQMITDLTLTHKVVMPPDVASALSPAQSWSGGQFVAMTFTWGNPQNIVEHPFQYTHLPWPFTQRKVIQIGGNCYALNADSKNLKSAFDAMWFVTTDDMWCQFRADSYHNPAYDTRSHIDRIPAGVNKNLANKMVHRDPKIKSADYPGGGDGIFMPRWLGNKAGAEVQKITNTMTEEMVLGTKTVEQALADAKAEIDQLLS